MTDRKNLAQKAKRQIIIIAILGMIILIVDVLSIYMNEEIKLIKQDEKNYMIKVENYLDAAMFPLEVKIYGEGKIFKKNVKVPIYEDNKKKNDKNEVIKLTKEDMIDQEIREILSKVGETKGKSIRLPSKLSSGENIVWEQHKTNNSIIIIFMTIMLMGIIYKSRYSKLEKQKKEEINSIVTQLPEFVNRIVLLLNAGLVLNSAFEQSIEGNMNFKKGKKDYFNSKLEEIYIRVRKTNGSMNNEFSQFAKGSSSKELIRISNIMNDNINKGVELTTKLQGESQLLWLNRKKNCEERGKLTETKLTLPLMLFLLVLITITISPALLEL